MMNRDCTSPFVSVIFAILRVKSLKHTIELVDQNIWDNADAEQVYFKGW